ncbi:MAG: class I SAM-dependent methyltransferase [Sporichthyaceae bacterium]
MSSEYVLTDAADEPESARLAQLEAMYDVPTRRRLGEAAVAPGWRVADLGAGRGSVARQLSELVGAGGHVVAVDMNPRFLVDLPANVEVRRMDVTVEDLEPNAYDLVHCRALLMHLPDPAAVLRSVARALRPGGLLLAEEGVACTLHVGGHPDAAWCTEFLIRAFDALTTAKIMQSNYGLDLPGAVVEAGLELVAGDVHAPITLAEGSAGRFLAMSFAAIEQRLTASGLATAADLARLQSALASPATTVIGYGLSGVLARRPA